MYGILLLILFSSAIEAKKIKSVKGYRTPATVLKKLAESRLELTLDKKAVQFDVTDLSRAYAAILKDRYSNKRKPAEELAAKKLAAILQIKNCQEVNLQYVLKNWSILLLNNEKELRSNSGLKKILKKLFELKAGGSEEEYIYGLQGSVALKKMMERVLDNINPKHFSSYYPVIIFIFFLCLFKVLMSFLPVQASLNMPY